MWPIDPLINLLSPSKEEKNIPLVQKQPIKQKEKDMKKEEVKVITKIKIDTSLQNFYDILFNEFCLSEKDIELSDMYSKYIEPYVNKNTLVELNKLFSELKRHNEINTNEVVPETVDKIMTSMKKDKTSMCVKVIDTYEDYCELYESFKTYAYNQQFLSHYQTWVSSLRSCNKFENPTILINNFNGESYKDHTLKLFGYFRFFNSFIVLRKLYNNYEHFFFNIK